MRSLAMSVVGILLFGGIAAIGADQDKPNLSGTWKLDRARTSGAAASQDLVLVIEETGGNIHIKETRGHNPKDDVSEFTCGTLGDQCAMRDGGDKAEVSAYYNGPLLVVLKTHGRKGSTVEKQRLSLSPAGDSLILELMPIQPEGKTEKLVLSKAP